MIIIDTYFKINHNLLKIGLWGTRRLYKSVIWLKLLKCPIGETGRRARFKIAFLWECLFDSGMGHHYLRVSYL